MKTHRSAIVAALLVLIATAASTEPPNPPFVPDLELRSLDGTHQLGRTGWTSRAGVLQSPAVDGNAWLVVERNHQDVEIQAEFRCSDPCRLGLLLRASSTPDGLLSGVLVPFGDAGRPAERIKVDTAGSIVERKALPLGSSIRRVATDPGERAPSVPEVRPASTNAQGIPFPPPDTGLRKGEWNSLTVYFDANLARVFVNDGGVGSWVADADGFGASGVFVEAGSRAEFRNVAIRDLARRERKPQFVAERFRKQVLNDFFYGWSAAAGDVNRDGAIDIVSGPFIYYGADFRRFREFSLAEPANPATEYPKFFEQYVADFTGDGWPDILAVRHAPPFGQLYINPRGESRRWEVATVIDLLLTEITALADIDGDGRPELIYTTPGELRAARPDPANPIGIWPFETLSKPRAAGEIIRLLTAMPPADSPKIVTCCGSPPNREIFVCTHFSAAIMSMRP